jgi:hypothetical protein
MTDEEYFNAALAWTKLYVTPPCEVVNELVEMAQNSFFKGEPIRIARRKASKNILNAKWNWPGLQNYEHLDTKQKTNNIDIGELFIHMILMKAYALRRHELRMKSTGRMPFLMFNPIGDASTPRECIELDGVIKRFDDPFWESHPIPCGKPFCRCNIIALSEKEAAKRGYSNNS